MAMVTFQEKKKEGYLGLIALAAIAFLVFMIFHHGSSKKTGAGAPASFQPNPYSLEEIEINLDVFKNPFFESALPFEKIKPFDKQIGRENPFAPYPADLSTSSATSTSASSSDTGVPPVIPSGPSI